MKRFIVAIVALIMTVQARADDCTGREGYYLNNAGECVECTISSSSAAYYCPGDGVQYPCPEIAGREVPDWLDIWPDATIAQRDFEGTPYPQPSITKCYAKYRLENAQFVSAYVQSYNAKTDKYDIYVNHWYRWPKAGYYMTNLRDGCSGSTAKYGAVAACPAGAYCPGKKGNGQCANGPAPENYGLEICPDNTYSDDGASECTPCPFGTENSGDSIDDHAGIDSCQPIECPAGQYLNDAGKCEGCGTEDYYCPGDNEQHRCPTRSLAAVGNLEISPGAPADSVPVAVSGESPMQRNFTKISQCLTIVTFENSIGRFIERARYNPETQKYDILDTTNQHQWNAVKPSYYLHTKANTTCGGVHYYREYSSCIAGAYCPGQTSISCKTDIEYAETFGIKVCPDNTYSDDGADACTPCPARTGNSGDTIDDHAGIGSCRPIECAAGEYLADDGRTCTTCEVGYYCPGDNERHYCSDKYPASTPSQTPYYSDEAGATDCKPCPEVEDEYKNGFFSYWYWIADGGTEKSLLHTKRSSCRATWNHSTPRGSFRFSCAYNSTGYTSGTVTKKCMTGNSSKPLECNAGYYIDYSNPVMEEFNSSGSWWTRSYQDMVETEWCYPVGVGYYSVAGAWQRTACPAGTSTHTDTAASKSECESLCAAGATEFHVGDYVFNIWPNSECESPAIRLGLPGGTCCVRMERNDGPGLNVDIDGTVYHTVN